MMFGQRKEKRKFIRLPAHHLLKYRVVGKENSEGILSFVRNISAGGLLFHSKQNIPQESTIELDIAINFPPREEPIKVLAKVQRAKFLKKVGGYDIGIKFINLDTHTRDLINNRIINSSK